MVMSTSILLPWPVQRAVVSKKYAFWGQVLFVRLRADLPVGFLTVSIPAYTVMVMSAPAPVARAVKSSKGWS